MADTQRYLFDQEAVNGNTSLYSFADVALQDAQRGPDSMPSGTHDFSPYSAASHDGYYRNSIQFAGPNMLSPGIPASPSVLGLSNMSGFDDYSTDPRFVESQRELRSLLFTSAHSLAPTRTGTPLAEGQVRVEEDHNSTGITRLSSTCMRDIVTTGKRVTWLQNYIQEVAPWLDMFDVQQTFGRTVPIIAQSSVPLVYAILAISARQMERQKKLQGLDSLQLYQESIKSLTPQLLAHDPNIMATCVILCCLEMMSAMPRNWRKHLDGCAALFDSHSINGFSTGLLQAVFWCYARMDLCAAIISEGEQSLVLPLENWLPPDVRIEDSTAFWATQPVPDMWANHAVFLCGRVCHLMWERAHETDPDGVSNGTAEPFDFRWHTLWLELAAWSRDRPPELLPLDFASSSAEKDQSRPFPFVLFAAACAISGNQLYHTACLLLLDMKPPSIRTEELGQVGSKLWHARRICGISITNEHHGCLNNAIQPLWVAGKLLSHPVEHKAVIDLIKRIEVITGWGAKWRLQDLKEIWGYDRDAPI